VESDVPEHSVHELTVVGVRVELPSNQPIVLLKETTGDRYLPIWIGAVEATAIALAQQGVVPARPLTHDLLKDVLEGLGAELAAVTITDLREGIYFADLQFRNGVVVSARPSDAIALAIRAGTTIYAEEAVLEEAGVAIPDESSDETEVEVVERFREFLDQVSPEDFETGS
jgi:bifunctional DNase/RNase